MVGDWGIVLALTHAVAIGLYYLVTVIQKLVMWYWKQLISVATSPLLAVCMLFLQAWSGLTPDYLHFVLMRPWYLARVNQSAEGKNGFYAWFWEAVRGGVITPTYTVLIYDATDQIARLPEDRTADWTNRAKVFASKNDLDFRGIFDPALYVIQPRRVFVEKLADHFYFVTQN